MTSMAFVLVLALSAAGAAEAASDTVVTEAVVAAPLHEVWQAFTTREGIESWMVGAGDLDLRVGGLLRTSYQKGADLDGDAAIHQRILSIDPERMLSYQVIKSPKGFPFADQVGRTWTVIYFEPVDATHTKVTARMLGYTSDPDSQKMRAFFETGNRATLNALVKRFTSR